MKRVLIIGANSYIGSSFEAYLGQYPSEYICKSIGARGLKPQKEIFRDIDCVFCAAGIAHIKEKAENKQLYFKVNRDFVIEIAKAAKAAGVKQFILLSSMAVYGLIEGEIRKNTKPNPQTAYGESKLQADEEIRKLENDVFKFCCLRPPMVYGKNCKGNYQNLKKIILKCPIFPDYQNQRSMIYIGNLCEFAKECIDLENRGVFFPQNAEYVRTSEMVRLIAEANGKHIIFVKFFNWAIKAVHLELIRKVFGNLTYERTDIVGKYPFSESIKLSEKE